MKRLLSIFAKERGMTLVEVIVAVGLLSFVIIAILTLYSNTYETIRTNDSLLGVLHDTNLIMSYIGDDIRHTVAFQDDYQGEEAQIPVAAMKVVKGGSNQPEEVLIVYSLDAKRPNRLVRSVHIGERSTSLELSTLVQKLELIPMDERVFEVQLVVEDKVAGKVKSLQTSSAFALRY